MPSPLEHTVGRCNGAMGGGVRFLEGLVDLLADKLSHHRATIEMGAKRNGLPVQLVAAICVVESGGNVWAIRAEPHYRYLWDNRKQAPFRKLTHIERLSEHAPRDFHGIGNCTANTEWQGQQWSWGLMQTMGAVAREVGYRKPFVSGLCNPMDSVEVGCLHLVNLKKRFFREGGWDYVVAAYNAGTPHSQYGQQYAAKVEALVPGGFEALEA